ncbi:MAG: hypothetical protein K1X36_03740 [Pyrinomonadaceae bacterium]|nr:hypothetical protein [Pyrinomonadaceae bacterium]
MTYSKFTLLTLGLICVTVVTVGAQIGKDTCPKIVVEAPEVIFANGSAFNVYAKIEGDQSTTNFDWTVIRDSGTTTIMSKQWIKLETGRPKDTELIIAIAQPSDLSCKGFGISKTLAVANPGSPYILDTYGVVRWNEERARLDSAAMTMEGKPDAELIVQITFSPSDSNASKREYLEKISKYLLSKGKMQANRITFAISTSKGSRTTLLQPFPTQMMAAFPFLDAIVIKAEDLGTLRSLFSSKK